MPSPDTIWSSASSGQCDIGLARPRPGYTGVEVEPFLTTSAVCAIPRRHALTRKRSISVRDLVGEPLTSGGAGVEPRFVFMAQYSAARCGFVAEGLGLAIVDPVPAREVTGLPIA